MFSEKTLTCRDCGGDFLFTIGEQEFFSSKGLTNEPKRCPNCRVVLRAQRSGRNANVYEINCANCSAPTKVPFQPVGYKPVYCSTCLRTARAAEQMLA
jgi:CxxC-x17-CxxC domain-containing protein